MVNTITVAPTVDPVIINVNFYLYVSVDNISTY
jgi:hypothetical protein